MKHRCFAGDFEWTTTFLAIDRDTVKYPTGGNLSVPAFHSVKNTCRLSRLVALEWWRHIIAECGAFYPFDQLRKRHILVTLNGLIDGMGVVG